MQPHFAQHAGVVPTLELDEKLSPQCFPGFAQLVDALYCSARLQGPILANATAALLLLEAILHSDERYEVHCTAWWRRLAVMLLRMPTEQLDQFVMVS